MSSRCASHSWRLSLFRNCAIRTESIAADSERPGRIMQLLRQSCIRLPAALICLASFLALPVRLTSNGLCIVVLHAGMCPTIEGGDGACSCPMCRASGGARHHCHCACCNEGACTCGISSRKSDPWLLLVVDSATLPSHDEFYVNLPSSLLRNATPLMVQTIELPVPTPPPKA